MSTLCQFLVSAVAVVAASVAWVLLSELRRRLGLGEAPCSGCCSGCRCAPQSTGASSDEAEAKNSWGEANTDGASAPNGPLPPPGAEAGGSESVAFQSPFSFTVEPRFH